MDNKNILKEYETKNLILKKAEPEDLELIWKNVWRFESIAKNMLWEASKTLEEAKVRLDKTIKYQEEYPSYFIYSKENNEPIGFAGFKESDPGIYEETGIAIGENYQHKGYGKEIVELFKKIIFEDLHGKRFLYSVFSTNEISKELCKKAGFKFLKSKNITRYWDNKPFIIEIYYFDKEMYK